MNPPRGALWHARVLFVIKMIAQLPKQRLSSLKIFSSLATTSSLALLLTRTLAVSTPTCMWILSQYGKEDKEGLKEDNNKTEEESDWRKGRVPTHPVGAVLAQEGEPEHDLQQSSVMRG